MAYIYQITNDINQKIYVGKTDFSIEKRFKEHCRDAFRDRNEKRPLYAAMRKYGIEHFHISLLEETDNPEEREKFWIEELGSFKCGYNATIGGDGRAYIDKQMILSLWESGLNCTQIGQLTHHDKDHIAAILKGLSVEQEDILKKSYENKRKAVCQIDKDSDAIIAVFDSIQDAARQMISLNYSRCKPGTGATHISEVCRGLRKTFAGFKWKYL